MDRPWMDQLQKGLMLRFANGPSQRTPTIQMPANASVVQLPGMFGGNARPDDRSLVSYEDYSYGYRGSDPFLMQLAAVLNALNLGDR